MKEKKLCLILLLFAFLTAFLMPLEGQDIAVSSFRLLPNDLTARVDPVTNDNGQKCALVRIVTVERGFEFDPDALGMCKAVDESHAGEVWVWLAPGSRRLTIRHAQLGVLRNYEYPVAIEPACTYEMVLVSGHVITTVEEQNRSNYLVLSVTPPEAMVKIDGALVVLHQGQFSKLYPVGKHSYEVFCELFHPVSGTFEITPDRKTDLSVSLQPGYGYLTVNIQPECGATIFINGSNAGVTPYTSGRLKSGDYVLQAAHPLYEDTTLQVTVNDNQTTELTLALAPNFAEPFFVCADSSAEIWVNGQPKGVGQWRGQLPTGACKVEARRESHRTTIRQITFKAGDGGIIDLESPIPIVGKISVNSTPFGADILLDGEKMGTTPEILSHILVGSHRVEVVKSGFATETRTVTVTEGETADVSVKLTNLRQTEPKQEAQVLMQTLQPEDSRTPLKLLFTLNTAYSSRQQWSFGFRVGTLHKWGWNFSFMSNYRFKGFRAKEPEDGTLYVFDKKWGCRLAATAGVTWQPVKPLLLFLNMGYGYRNAFYHNLYDDEIYIYAPHSLQGVDLSLGVMANFRGVLLSLEVETLNFKYAEFKFGLGGLITIKKQTAR